MNNSLFLFKIKKNRPRLPRMLIFITKWAYWKSSNVNMWEIKVWATFVVTYGISYIMDNFNGHKTHFANRLLKFDERFRRQSHLEVQSNLDQDQIQLRKTTPILKTVGKDSVLKIILKVWDQVLSFSIKVYGSQTLGRAW